eukprot:3852165-Prymnesium_polylepis.2
MGGSAHEWTGVTQAASGCGSSAPIAATLRSDGTPSTLRSDETDALTETVAETAAAAPPGAPSVVGTKVKERASSETEVRLYSRLQSDSLHDDVADSLHSAGAGRGGMTIVLRSAGGEPTEATRRRPVGGKVADSDSAWTRRAVLLRCLGSIMELVESCGRSPATLHGSEADAPP